MLNPDFDPYLELQEAKVELLRQQKYIRQLCIAHNHNQELIEELVNQHQQAVDLIKSTRNQLDLLRNQVLILTRSKI